MFSLALGSCHRYEVLCKVRLLGMERAISMCLSCVMQSRKEALFTYKMIDSYVWSELRQKHETSSDVSCVFTVDINCMQNNGRFLVVTFLGRSFHISRKWWTGGARDGYQWVCDYFLFLNCFCVCSLKSYLLLLSLKCVFVLNVYKLVHSFEGRHDVNSQLAATVSRVDRLSSPRTVIFSTASYITSL